MLRLWGTFNDSQEEPPSYLEAASFSGDPVSSLTVAPSVVTLAMARDGGTGGNPDRTVHFPSVLQGDTWYMSADSPEVVRLKLTT